MPSGLSVFGRNVVSIWRLTATTIYCEAVDDDVTLVVDKDLNVHCIGYSRYAMNSEKETIRSLGRKSRELGRDLRCEGRRTSWSPVTGTSSLPKKAPSSAGGVNNV